MYWIHSHSRFARTSLFRGNKWRRKSPAPCPRVHGTARWFREIHAIFKLRPQSPRVDSLSRLFSGDGHERQPSRVPGECLLLRRARGHRSRDSCRRDRRNRRGPGRERPGQLPGHLRLGKRCLQPESTDRHFHAHLETGLRGGNADAFAAGAAKNAGSHRRDTLSPVTWPRKMINNFNGYYPRITFCLWG